MKEIECISYSWCIKVQYLTSQCDMHGLTDYDKQYKRQFPIWDLEPWILNAKPES